MTVRCLSISISHQLIIPGYPQPFVRCTIGTRNLKLKVLTMMEVPMTKVLIYGGKTGWIGGLMYDMCKEKGESFVSHLENFPSFTG